MARYRSITEPKVGPKRSGTAEATHWHTSAAITASMLVGLAFAIAHDRFYSHYNNRAVKSGLEQKIIHDVGTACAFLVKMVFCISAGTAFSQELFRTLRHRAETITNIDAMFDIRGNAFNFRKTTLWLRHSVLALIATVVWCLPAAAVFTPGTINVQPEIRHDHNALLKPAQPQQSWIGTQNFAQTQIDYTALTANSTGTYAHALLNGPSGTLHGVALGSASLQDVLSIPPPSTNSSYVLSFFAPALSCKSLSTEDLSDFEAALAAARKAQYLPGQRTILGGVESMQNADGLMVRYNAWIESYKGVNLTNPSWNNGTSDQTLPGTGPEYFYLSGDPVSLLLACNLYNATYNVKFTFENSVQTIDLQSVNLHETIPLDKTVNVNTPNYGNLVYNAVLHAFNRIVIACAINDTNTNSPNFLSYGPGPVLVSALHSFIEGTTPLTSFAVITTLQEMFHNITLSTLSVPSLRLSDTTARTIRGTTWRSVNVYVYGPVDLYIAYGSALLATMACVAWGVWLVLSGDRASYSLDFSTILRTTRQSEIDGIVNLGARTGREPLPREMREVKLRYGGDDGFLIVSEKEGVGVEEDGDRGLMGTYAQLPQTPRAGSATGQGDGM